jgi:hypothetical protein
MWSPSCSRRTARKAVAKRAAGFDMRVLYHNRNRDRAAESDLGVHYASMDELLAQSQFVCLNVPLTAQTDKLIGEAQLRAMKPGAFLINTARGAVVNTDALLRAERRLDRRCRPRRDRARTAAVRSPAAQDAEPGVDAAQRHIDGGHASADGPACAREPARGTRR